MKCELLVYIPLGSTFKNYIFRHTVYWVDIRKKIAIFSMYCISWLVFIIETEHVYCAVSNGSLNIFQVNLIP